MSTTCRRRQVSGGRGRAASYYLTQVNDQGYLHVWFRSGVVQNWNGHSRRRAWDGSESLHRLTDAPSELANRGEGSSGGVRRPAGAERHAPTVWRSTGWRENAEPA